VKKNRTKFRNVPLQVEKVHAKIEETGTTWYLARSDPRPGPTLPLKPLNWSFRIWTPTPRLRFYCAETSTWTLCKTCEIYEI